MKRNLLIFALLLVASCDTINDCQRFDVTTSPASPVEFWPIDCDTFNEKEVCGVYSKCFCDPWNCDDVIKVPYSDTPSDDANYTPISSPELSSYLTTDTPDPLLIPWTTGATPSVTTTVNGFGVPRNSEYLYIPFAFIADNKYKIEIEFTNSANVLLRRITGYVLDSSMNEIQSDFMNFVNSGTYTFTFEFVATEDSDFFALSVSGGTPATTVTITSRQFYIGIPDDFALIIIDSDENEIDSVPFDVINTSASSQVDYLASFVPSELNICNQKIRLEIRNVTVSPDSSVQKSGCLDVRNDHPCTYLWEYWNNKNILGLVYENVSPTQTFFIRVPMTFRLEEFPEEEEVMELTQSVEVLNSQIMEKKLVEVGYVPYYFHRKLKYILKHQFITIDGQSWIKADEYKVIEGNKMWPVKMGEVWLTEKNSVQRAVL